MPLSDGQVLQNRYRIGALLGQGGMGAVYRATDLRFGTSVAIKENLVFTEEAQRQFSREAGLLHELRHPNLPRVTDYFPVPGQGQYLVMDYVEGLDLGQILEQRGPLPESLALAWFLQVLNALDYLHGRSVIHRDVKPANVKVTPDGQVFLVDFGVAKVRDPNQRTTAGAQRVSPGYAPPEQYGVRSTDARSDVYAAGATLYAMLVGYAPPDALERVTKEADLPPLRAQRPELRPDLDAAILRALEVAPVDRFQTAAEFRAALSGPGHAAAPLARAGLPQPAGPSERAPARRPRVSAWGVIGAIASLLLLAAGLAWMLKTCAGGTPAPAGIDATNTALSLAFLSATPSPPPSPNPAPPTRTWTPAATRTMTATPTPTASRTPFPTATPSQTPSPVPSPTQKPTATRTPAGPKAGSSRTRASDGMRMVYVPAGSFLMGSTEADIDAAALECNGCSRAIFGNEKPQHSVALDAFWIDATEVTMGQYDKCVSAGACRVADMGLYDPTGRPDYPVVQVTWNDAVAYCMWAGGRLPTEAEWEKAARGTDGRRYPWGNTTPDCTRANYLGKPGGCVGGTARVGSYPAGASAYGALDMAGNVWEWVSDWYGATYFETSPAKNPGGPEWGGSRVLKGGSYSLYAFSTRSTNRRGRDSPGVRNKEFGFRCVVPAASP